MKMTQATQCRRACIQRLGLNGRENSDPWTTLESQPQQNAQGAPGTPPASGDTTSTEQSEDAPTGHVGDEKGDRAETEGNS
jgi:hypothetical protein